MRSEACRVVVKCRPTRADEAEGLGDGIHVPAPGRVRTVGIGICVTQNSTRRALPGPLESVGLLFASYCSVCCKGGAQTGPATDIDHMSCALQITLGKDFEADRVYLSSDGDAVYEDEVQALVASLYDGINSTVFAYGEPAKSSRRSETCTRRETHSAHIHVTACGAAF